MRGFGRGAEGGGLSLGLGGLTLAAKAAYPKTCPMDPQAMVSMRVNPAGSLVLKTSAS